MKWARRIDEADPVRCQVEHARLGDREAAAWLFDRFQRRVLRFCHKGNELKHNNYPLNNKSHNIFHTHIRVFSLMA